LTGCYIARRTQTGDKTGSSHLSPVVDGNHMSWDTLYPPHLPVIRRIDPTLVPPTFLVILQRDSGLSPDV
jgi:hypothetical protein